MKKTLTTNEIKQKALELGFDVVGVVHPDSLKEGEKAVDAWVGQGMHGDMKYLEDFRERRERFFSEFGDVRSVIVLGVNYFSKENSSKIENGWGQGRVARYAWGKDYHYVIRQRHEALIELLQQNINEDFKAKSCVDTQPIPERFAAKAAGLGFVGKHTGLLNKDFGPWLFLSEIVTNLDLDEDEPSSGDCGTCVHCQDVCPTGALDKDYQLDARLCIAYLTIEHKGAIARELRPMIKDWIFGCDECLVVCPFTSKSQTDSWEELKASEGAGEWIQIPELFEITSNSQFEKRFFGTPLMRVGRKQMLRNACIVLGNSGKKEAIPFLERGLKDKAALVRQHAAWALGQLSFEECSGLLEAAGKAEKDPEVQDEIRLALEASPIV